MDAPSQNVSEFLAALQTAMKRLGSLWNHYTKLGTRPQRPYLSLSASPFRVHDGESTREFSGSVALGLLITGADGREYQFGVDVLWDAREWTLQTEAWVEAEEGGQTLLRSLPEGRATDLSSCLTQLHAAVDSLTSFDDLLPKPSGKS
jgi:hypothetical protein